MRIAHIENNEIVQVSIAPDDAVLSENCMLESDAVAQGYTYRRNNPSRKIWPSKADFWNEFTMQEKITLAASTSDMVKYFFAELTIWDGEVWSDDARVIQGLDLLQSLQLITAERRAEIIN